MHTGGAEVRRFWSRLLIVPRPVIRSMPGILYLQEKRKAGRGEEREKEGKKGEKVVGEKNGWKEEMILSNEACFGLLP